MNYETVVTCAVTGAGDTTGRNKHVPVTPKLGPRRAIQNCLKRWWIVSATVLRMSS